MRLSLPATSGRIGYGDAEPVWRQIPQSTLTFGITGRGLDTHGWLGPIPRASRMRHVGNMSRLCGYRVTTTGRPCEQMVRDSGDHCEAGHPCPPVARAEPTNTHASIIPDQSLKTEEALDRVQQVDNRNGLRPRKLNVPLHTVTNMTESATLLPRFVFRSAVLERDDHKCVACGKEAVDVHHVLTRHLWTDGGYYKDNGV